MSRSDCPFPSMARLAGAGLACGMVINLVDTPWSLWFGVPRLNAFAAAHQLQGSALVGSTFMLVHLLLGLALAWIYATARTVHGAGTRTALLVAAVMLVVNRGFGFANVLLGVMPGEVFAGLSLSFVVAVTLGTLLAARVIDRAPASA